MYYNVGQAVKANLDAEFIQAMQKMRKEFFSAHAGAGLDSKGIVSAALDKAFNGSTLNKNDPEFQQFIQELTDFFKEFFQYVRGMHVDHAKSGTAQEVISAYLQEFVLMVPKFNKFKDFLVAGSLPHQFISFEHPLMIDIGFCALQQAQKKWVANLWIKMNDSQPSAESDNSLWKSIYDLINTQGIQDVLKNKQNKLITPTTSMSIKGIMQAMTCDAEMREMLEQEILLFKNKAKEQQKQDLKLEVKRLEARILQDEQELKAKKAKMASLKAELLKLSGLERM